MKARGRKRKLSYEAVIAYSVANPTMLQAEIAAHFGTSQSRVSHILRQGGVQSVHPGRPLKQHIDQTTEEYKWEKILHDAGLGMERGLRLSGKRILYGYDPLKEGRDDGSATSNAAI